MKIRYIVKYVYSSFLNIRRNFIVDIYAVLHPRKYEEINMVIKNIIDQSKISL